MVDYIPELKFVGNKDEDLLKIVGLLDVVDLGGAIKKWSLISHYSGILLPTQEDHDSARIKQDKIYNHLQNNESVDRENEDYKHNVLKYRVTCDRIGQKHSFSSNEAAYKFGGEVNNRLRWIVALSDYDLNILLRIQQGILRDFFLCFILSGLYFRKSSYML